MRGQEPRTLEDMEDLQGPLNDDEVNAFEPARIFLIVSNMEQAEQWIASKLNMTCDPKIGDPN